MDIRTALIEAKRKGNMICRPFGEMGARLVVKPPSDGFGILDCGVKYPMSKDMIFYPAWTPSVRDLMADDWELFSREEK